MQERVALVWNGLLDVIYPPVCLVCGAHPQTAFCEVCRKSITPILPPFCDRCGNPVPADRLVCTACELGPAPSFDWSQAMGRYEGLLRRAIHLLKYRGKTALAEPLGTLLSASLDAPASRLLSSSRQPAFDLVVPVPLHPSRLRKRGFNQSELLAQVVARERGLQLDTDGLRRIRRTQSQITLNVAERAANVQGAFAARAPLYFSGKSVLLIDDVLTTAATVKEAAKAIREAGAKRVCVAALAHGV